MQFRNKKSGRDISRMHKLQTIHSLLLIYLVSSALFSCTKDNTVVQQQPYVLPTPVSGINYSADEVAAFKQLSLNTTGIIVKLPPQVSVYLADTTYPYMTKELDSIISEINGLLDSNLVMTRTTDRSNAILKVHLTDRATYMQFEPAVRPTLENSNYNGMTYDIWDGGGVVYHGTAFVDMARTDKDTLQQRYIIHHEIMHALGFMGHVSLPQFYSIMFNYAVTPYILDYTPFDKKMMRLLYNSAIKTGLTEKEFDAAVTKL